MSELMKLWDAWCAALVRVGSSVRQCPACGGTCVTDGEWNYHYDSYKWQRLNGGHSALSDCQAALECLCEMAYT
jgi:hypothetical protein